MVQTKKDRAVYQRKYRAAHVDYYREKCREWRKLPENKRKLADVKQERRAWYRAYKRQHPCEVCGEAHPACLDFHHREPARKVKGIAHMAVSHTKERVLAEIAKCIVLCANCHRKLHWEDEF